MYSSIFCYRYRFCQVRYLPLFFHTDGFCFDRTVYKHCILMIFVHIKYMIGWCQDHISTICKDNGLKNIYDLRKVCHLYSVTVFVKDIQSDTCDQGISHCVLLIQEARVCAWFHCVPCAPLVNDHTDLFLRIIFVHDMSVTLDQSFHKERFIQTLIPYLIIKICSTSLDLPSFRMYIIMKRKTIHISVKFFQTMIMCSL